MAFAPQCGPRTLDGGAASPDQGGALTQFDGIATVTNLRARPLAAAALATCLAASAALAGASSTPFEAYQPDPALRTAPRADLEARVRRACAITQARLQSTPEGSLDRPCGCYASRTLRTLDAAEIESYRTTGYFNDSARAKALAALDSCHLKRPV